MADLLTHVLVAYVVLTLVSWRVEWLNKGWIAVGMGGAVLPDLVKVRLVIDNEALSALLGLPFSFGALSTLGGVVLTAGVVTLLFRSERWPRVYGLLVAGGVMSLLLDGMRAWADGRASAWLYPFLPDYRPPTPSLYVTSDPRVVVVAVFCATIAFAVDRWLVEA